MMGRLVSFVVLVVVTSFLLVLSYQVVSVFLLPLFLAAVAVLLFRPAYLLFLRWCRGRRYVAAALMTTSVMLAVLVPFVVGFLVAGIEAAQLIDKLEGGALQKKLSRLRSGIGLDYPYAAECRFIESSLSQLLDEASAGVTATGNPRALAILLDEFRRLHAQVAERPPEPIVPNPDPVIRAFVTAAESLPGTLAYQQSIETAIRSFRGYQLTLHGGPWAISLKELTNPPGKELRTWTEQIFAVTPGQLATFSGRTGSMIARTVVGLLVFVMATFFWFADGPRIIKTLMELSPLDDRYEEQLLAEFEMLVRAVVAGSIASALAQTILAGLGYWFVGLDSIFLLMALTALMAMVPFVGSTLIWIPVCVWLALGEGRPVAGAGLAIYCVVIVSTVDNIVRPWILLERASLHPLAALIGVLGGAQALGPTGIFVGPIVVAFLQTVLTLLHREFTEMDADNSDGKGDTSSAEAALKLVDVNAPISSPPR